MGIEVFQDGVYVETIFQNRVVTVKRYLAHKNLSDTKDVSDFQTVECVEALVWLGQENWPPVSYDHQPEPTIRYPLGSSVGYGGMVRELEPIEQFAWLDCSNLFVWRGRAELRPEADTGDILDPEAASMYPLWQEFVSEKVKHLTKVARDRKRYLDDLKAAERAKADKKDARLESTRAAADAVHKLLPPIGTVMEYDGFTGKLFWKAVKPFRNKYRSRIGLKDGNGFIRWIDSDKLNLVGK